MTRPILAFTQGDPAGIGPEVVLKALSSFSAFDRFQPVLLAERAALVAARPLVPPHVWERLTLLAGNPRRAELAELAERIPVFDPIGSDRLVALGSSSEADARGALAALDTGIDFALGGVVDALVTAPVSKASIAKHVRPHFVGHTDYLAAACGLKRYGRDYLMAFLAPDLKVALLTVHVRLRDALRKITKRAIVEAVACLHRHAPGKIVVAGLNPHAGEEGLLGNEELTVLAPAVEESRRAGIDVAGPESADSLFARARRGEFDWVLALYHDQGLIAVKTAAFGAATNWTVGLPFLRTSVDHGTAFRVAGTGKADEKPMLAVIDTTLRILAGRASPSSAA